MDPLLASDSSDDESELEIARLFTLLHLKRKREQLRLKSRRCQRLYLALLQSESLIPKLEREANVHRNRGRGLHVLRTLDNQLFQRYVRLDRRAFNTLLDKVRTPLSMLYFC